MSPSRTDPSPMSDTADSSRAGQRDQSGSRRGRWIGLVVLIVLVGAYVSLALFAAARVPAGTQVLGVTVGGMSRAEALAALEPAAAQAGSAALTLTLEDRSAVMVPAESGLALDAPATVDALTGLSLNPYAILRTFTGGAVAAEPVTAVDDDALRAAVESAATELDMPATDASVTIRAAGATVEESAEGLGVDVDATASVIASSWPVAEVAAVELVLEPHIDSTAARAFAAELNSVVLVGDVTLSGENGDATVTSRQLARHSTVMAVDGELMLVVDGAALAPRLESAQPELVTAPVAASYRFTAGHNLKTFESSPGRGIDPAALGPAVVAAAYSPLRAGVLPYRDTEPGTSSDDLDLTDLTAKVAEFSTPLTPEPIRTRNLVRGAEMVTGAMVRPGETFSLIDALSPITAENGYYPAHVIVDGYLADGIGGGLSQMATTLYNATYFAGLEDVEHRPHSKYFSRYPAGRESTIYIGAIDVKFRNNTPYTLVLNSYVDDDRLHVDVWSTPHFTVRTEASDRTNIVKARMVTADHEGCLDTPVGSDGFTITNTREVYLDGELVDTRAYTWTYSPNNGVTCV